MQIKLVIITICALLVAIDFAAPAPQAGPDPFKLHPPGDIVADSLDDFAAVKHAAAFARKFRKLSVPPLPV
ncbi:hypothetical protein BCV72DRAFT_301217 [Rhizopus microsporus var. microsporus]|uniref:Uncharacterized protein n=1 Tax=Rhizopus microsporus var. microsporus TaxID=86635 RepID=A0A1X0RGE3_RHIZD|nr:hypothetical protein BCV72DRAFT_301217 [Rhizopus microsporus var. microsporus]